MSTFLDRCNVPGFLLNQAAYFYQLFRELIQMNYLLLLFLVPLISCTNNRIMKVESTSITISTDSLSSIFAISEFTKIFNDVEYLVRSNADMHSIDFYNLNSKTLERRVVLPFYFEAFTVVSLDSIYAIENEVNALSLFNSNGQLLDVLKLDSLLNTPQQQFVVYASSSNMLTLVDGKFIFNITANSIVPSYYKFPTIAIYDNELSTLAKAGNFPEFMQNDRVWLSFSPIFCINQKNEIINSFEPDNYLYIYDFKGQLIRTVAAKSKYIDDLSPLPKDKSFHRKYSEEYEITRARYGMLAFDEYRQLYYRVAIHSQELSNSDGTVNSYNSNKWSIIVMDSNFNIIDEILMKANKYSPSSLIISKDGLLVQKNEELSSSLEFELLKIKVSR